MNRIRIIAAAAGVFMLSAGCGPKHQACNPWSHPGEQGKLTVRFVAPADDASFAEFAQARSTALVSHNPATSEANYGTMDADGGPSGHALLWGGPYDGADVSRTPADLPAGKYMFGLFDPDQGAAYQGWMAVNNGGDDVLSALTQWRDEVHQQEEWLAFENKISGKFASRDADDFARFSKQLKSLRRLEGQINASILAERRDQQRMAQARYEALGDAQLLVMPGPSGFMVPTTNPAFGEGDLSVVRNGRPMTKVILAGDFRRSMEKLDRVTEMQDELNRCRTVFAEEANRLQNRRNYYRVTSHLFNHDGCFMNNERRMQHVRGMIAQLDRQMTENRRRGHALMFVAGLFAPEEAEAAFDREQASLRRERAVLAEQQRQIDMQYNDCNGWSEKRVALERQRQDLAADMERIDAQFKQVEQARVASAKIRETTGVIHRQGPTAVLAASVMDNQLPARLADAIERESMMTIRLQAADGMNGRPESVTNNAWGTTTRSTTILTSDRP